MEEDDPKKAFECFEEAIKHRSRSALPLFVFPVRSCLMISISSLFMNEFAKAVKNFIKSSELDDQFDAHRPLRHGGSLSNLPLNPHFVFQVLVPYPKE